MYESEGVNTGGSEQRTHAEILKKCFRLLMLQVSSTRIALSYPKRQLYVKR